MVKIKQCAVCDSDFTAKSEKANYCSNACRALAYRKRKEQRQKQEHNIEIKQEQNKNEQLEMQVEVIEKKLNKFQTEIYHVILKFTKDLGEYVHRDIYLEEQAEVRSKLNELPKLFEAINNEIEDVRKQNINNYNAIKRMTLDIRAIKSVVNHHQNLLKNSFADKATQNLADFAEKLLTNDRLIEKLADIMPNSKKQVVENDVNT